MGFFVCLFVLLGFLLFFFFFLLFKIDSFIKFSTAYSMFGRLKQIRRKLQCDDKTLKHY